MLNYLYVTSIVSICVLLYEVSISVFTCLFQMAFAFFIEFQNSLHIKSIRFFFSYTMYCPQDVVYVLLLMLVFLVLFSFFMDLLV